MRKSREVLEDFADRAGHTVGRLMLLPHPSCCFHPDCYPSLAIQEMRLLLAWLPGAPVRPSVLMKGRISGVSAASVSTFASA